MILFFILVFFFSTVLNANPVLPIRIDPNTGSADIEPGLPLAILSYKPNTNILDSKLLATGRVSEEFKFDVVKSCVGKNLENHLRKLKGGFIVVADADISTARTLKPVKLVRKKINVRVVARGQDSHLDFISDPEGKNCN